MQTRHFLLLLCFFFCQLSFAQTVNTSWERYLDEYCEMEDVESAEYKVLHDALEDLAEAPIDINTATWKDLERVPFLSAQQIEDICYYVYRYGPLQTEGELAMIPSLDTPRRNLLKCFIFFGQPVVKDTLPDIGTIVTTGKHELTGMMKIPTYKRAGDKNGYRGYNLKHFIRYTFNYRDHVKAGFVGAQDSGEPFFANKNSWGYDYYSFYLQLKNIGRLQSLVVGRYRLRFGMGLVMNNNLMLGKLPTIDNLARSTNVISGHSSRMDIPYLQGAAATVNVAKNIDLTAFASYRSIDGTMNKDSASFATWVTTGYHRTDAELAKKNNVKTWAAGGHIAWRNRAWRLGFTGYAAGFDKELKPNTNVGYRKYYAAGKNFWNISADYGYVTPKFAFQGETATGDCGAIATINSVSYTPSTSLRVLAIQRFYSYKYYTLYGKSFSDNGYVRNESGVLLGGSWEVAGGLTVMGYTDYCYFPWKRYQTSDASHSWDNVLQATYQTSKTTFLLRYRLKRREKDNEDKTALIWETTHRGRFSVHYEDGLWWSKTQADIAYCTYKDKSFGWMLSEQAGIQQDWWRIYGIVGYFNTDDYSSRLYVYERGLLYNFYMPSYYGEGLHFAVLGRADFGKHWMAMLKLSTTKYFDRDVISSGLQQIDASAQTDIELMLRYKFGGPRYKKTKSL